MQHGDWGDTFAFTSESFCFLSLTVQNIPVAVPLSSVQRFSFRLRPCNFVFPPPVGPSRKLETTPATGSGNADSDRRFRRGAICIVTYRIVV